VSIGQIDTLYPCFLLTDTDLVLESTGHSVARLLPEMAAGDRLEDWFEFERPIARFDPVEAAHDRVNLHMRSRDGRLQLAGQVLAVEQRYLFCLGHSLRGSATWPVLGLVVEDFCNADSSLAASNAMDIQRGLLTDLQDLVDKLKSARDEARAASEAKSAFLSAMSHEIRTPLNGVLGMTQAMIRDARDPQLLSRLDVVRKSGDAALAVLNDLLDIARIESGRMTLEILEFDLGEVLAGSYAAFTELANSKGISFGLDISAAAGRYRSDPGRIRQVIYNLLSNAVKFTETGQVRLEARPFSAGVEIRVSDSGIGIAPDRLVTVFDAFTQADSTIRRRFGGTGLGLAITRELIALLGGEISVESVEGKGTQFIVQLPLDRVQPATDEAGPGYQEEAARGEMPPGASALRILAAEDNMMNQLVLRTLLEQVGISPELVTNGREAIAAWEAQPWDIILMDIQMPELDGLSATRLIREMERATGRAPTPIIALTANAMSHQVGEYMQAGFTAVVAKPIDVEALMETLRKCLEELPGD
jgi:signal transduction histidine kinase/ActR/RegA family two-component response regulator